MSALDLKCNGRQEQSRTPRGEPGQLGEALYCSHSVSKARAPSRLLAAILPALIDHLSVWHPSF